MVKETLGWLGVAITAFAMYLFVFNYQAVHDWWFMLSYEAPAAVENLADESAMSNLGRRIFYLQDPSIETKTSFHQVCDIENNIEDVKVVGCYVNNRIYVLDIEPGPLEIGEIVTAAHEMLHAAYVRLPQDERAEIDDLLLEEIRQIDDKKIQKEAEIQLSNDPDSFLNEMHSTIGTEVADLDPELEDHYKKYFEDRSVVLEFAEAYTNAFDELEIQIQELVKEINQLVIFLNEEGKRLEGEFQVLDQQRIYLQSKIDAGNINNNLINELEVFEKDVDKHNDDVQFYRDELKRYEDLNSQYGELALKYDDLKSVLDGYENLQEIVK